MALADPTPLAMLIPEFVPHGAEVHFPTRRADGREPGGDSLKTWTAAGGNGSWSNGSNWTPNGVPVADDSLAFPTLALSYTVTNDLAGSGPAYGSITIDGTAAGKPGFVGGFNTNELSATSSGGSAFASGIYSFVTRTTLRGQTVTNLNAGASLVSTSIDPTLYLWDQSLVNVNSGASIELLGDRGAIAIDDSSTFNVNSGGSVRTTYALISNDHSIGPRTISVNGASANMRVDFQTLVHTAGFGSPAQTVSFSISNGGTFSTGIIELNENPTAAGLSADTNINVNDATFDVSNASGFENSYFMSGAADGPGTTTINLANGGQFHVRDTDGSGQAFAVLSNSYRADTAVTIGGVNGSGTKSTMQVDGLLFVAPADRAASAVSTTTANITVNNAGRLIVRDASVFACDYGYSSTLTVNSGGFADLGNRAIFSGGSADLGTSTGAGQTTVNVDGGELRAGSFEYMGDSRSAPGSEGFTDIVVRQSTGKMVAYGVDDPLTPEIDSGIFVASRGNGTTASDLATGGQVHLSVDGAGTIEANEAFFAGDMQSGNFIIALDGSAALLDAGGLFAVNERGLPSSTVTINVSNGANLAATASSTGAPGVIRVNPVAGSGTASITLNQPLSTIQSTGAIHLGGRLIQTSPGVFTHGVGSVTTVTADVGTAILAGAELYLASGSTLTTNGRFEANDTFIDGNWIAGNGDASNVIRTGDLSVSAAGTVTVGRLLPANPLLLVAGNVTIDPGAKIDLKQNAMRIRPDPSSPTPTTLASLKLLLAHGRTGSGLGGIASSTVTSSTAIGYGVVTAAGSFRGEPTLPDDLLVRFTLKGDSDLNGIVNFDDLLNLAQHYNSNAGEWFTGDFTFDGNVNFDDLLAVAQNYGTSLLGSGSSGSFSSDWALAQSFVPEPTAIAALLGIAGVVLHRRRRDRSTHQLDDRFASRGEDR